MCIEQQSPIQFKVNSFFNVFGEAAEWFNSRSRRHYKRYWVYIKDRGLFYSDGMVDRDNHWHGHGAFRDMQGSVQLITHFTLCAVHDDKYTCLALARSLGWT